MASFVWDLTLIETNNPSKVQLLEAKSDTTYGWCGRRRAKRGEGGPGVCVAGERGWGMGRALHYALPCDRKDGQALNSLVVFLANIMAFTDPPSITGWFGRMRLHV